MPTPGRRLRTTPPHGECTDMIFYALARAGPLGSLNGEKLRFFLGWTCNPLFLSRRHPLVFRLNPLRLLFSPRYARGVATWLRYRADLYDGVRG